MKKIYYTGSIYYIDDNIYHRIGMPADNYWNGSGSWSRSHYFNDKFHKMNGSSRKNDNQTIIYCVLYNTKIKINIEKLVI